MPCHWMKMPDGTVVHINAARQPRKRCRFCSPASAGFVTLLCDFEIAPGKTCDAGMCAGCAKPAGEDRDYCPDHAGRK